MALSWSCHYCSFCVTVYSFFLSLFPLFCFPSCFPLLLTGQIFPLHLSHIWLISPALLPEFLPSLASLHTCIISFISSSQCSAPSLLAVFFHSLALPVFHCLTPPAPHPPYYFSLYLSPVLCSVSGELSVSLQCLPVKTSSIARLSCPPHAFGFSTFSSRAWHAL